MYQGPGGVPTGVPATDAVSPPALGAPSWDHARGPEGLDLGIWDQGLRAGLIQYVGPKQREAEALRQMLEGHLGNLKKNPGVCVCAFMCLTSSMGAKPMLLRVTQAHQ